MAITVYFSERLRGRTGGDAEITVEGATLGQTRRELNEKYPGFESDVYSLSVVPRSYCRCDQRKYGPQDESRFTFGRRR